MRDASNCNKLKLLGPTSVGTVQAMALDVPERSLYGTYFETPVGENLTTVPPQMFEHTSLHIISSADNTTLNIDKDNSGSYETTVVLGQGEVYHEFGGVLANARISSDNPVSVAMVTGDVADANGWEKSLVDLDFYLKSWKRLYLSCFKCWNYC